MIINRKDIESTADRIKIAFKKANYLANCDTLQHELNIEHHELRKKLLLIEENRRNENESLVKLKELHDDQIVDMTVNQLINTVVNMEEFDQLMIEEETSKSDEQTRQLIDNVTGDEYGYMLPFILNDQADISDDINDIWLNPPIISHELNEHDYSSMIRYQYDINIRNDQLAQIDQKISQIHCQIDEIENRKVKFNQINDETCRSHIDIITIEERNLNRIKSKLRESFQAKYSKQSENTIVDYDLIEHCLDTIVNNWIQIVEDWKLFARLIDDLQSNLNDTVLNHFSYLCRFENINLENMCESDRWN